MSRGKRTAEVQGSSSNLDLRHLRRDTRTALELAVVALAPEDLIDGLAAVAGLLEALEELPRDSPPVMAIVPQLAQRSRKVLRRWKTWHARHLARITA